MAENRRAGNHSHDNRDCSPSRTTRNTTSLLELQSTETHSQALTRFLLEFFQTYCHRFHVASATASMAQKKEIWTK